MDTTSKEKEAGKKGGGRVVKSEVWLVVLPHRLPLLYEYRYANLSY
jgi:hypothetical protein